MAQSEIDEQHANKFEPRKTTDGCFTLPKVMEAINDYVAWRRHLEPGSFV